MTYAILFFLVLLSAALPLHPLADRLKLPFNALLVVAGFVGSEAVVGLGYDTGLRWYHFHDIAFYLLLPITLFRLVLSLDPKALAQVWLPVVLLALPYTLLTAFLVAAVLYWFIDHPSGFPWQSALVCGALLASSSPGTAVGLLMRREAPARLSMLVAGEGLLNSVVMIVLFELLLGGQFGDDAGQFAWRLGTDFGYVFCGGLLVGAGVGLVALGIKRLGKSSEEYSALSLAVCFGGFYLADALLGAAGAAGLLGSGLVWRYGELRTPPAENARQFSTRLWNFNNYLAGAVLFLLMGITVTPDMFVCRWQAMLAGIAAVLLARGIGVYLGLPVLARLSASPQREDRAILMWSAMRSVSAIALVLSLPESLEGWWTIQSIAYAVVLFSFFVQQTLLQRAVERVYPNE